MGSLTRFKVRCYEHHHMTPKEFGLYLICAKMTRGGKDKLFFDGRNMAARFAGASKSSIYRSVEKLVAGGWLLPLNGGGRKRDRDTRQYERTIYVVITHEQWVLKHGTKGCRDGEPVPNAGMEPVPSTGMVQSQNRENPVPYLGHSSTEPSLQENPLQSLTTSSIGSLSHNQQEQEGKCGGTPLCAAIPKDGNGLHTVPFSDFLSRFDQ